MPKGEKKKEKKKTEEDPDKIIAGYIEITKAHEIYTENPHDIGAVDIYSKIANIPVEEVVAGGPVSLGLGILEQKEKFIEKLQKNVSYEHILKKDSETIISLLTELPPLELGKEKYKDLALAHKNYFMLKLIEKKDPGEKRIFVAKYVREHYKERSKYIRVWEAADINALFIGIKLEAQRQLMEAVAKYKKPEEKKKK